MIRKIIYPKTQIETQVCREGKSIEEQMRQALTNKEPIVATAKLTYNDRKDGVLPQHDIRTDRFELATLATDKIHATKAAERQAMDYPSDTKEKPITNSADA